MLRTATHKIAPPLHFQPRRPLVMEVACLALACWNLWTLGDTGKNIPPPPSAKFPPKQKLCLPPPASTKPVIVQNTFSKK